MSQREPSYGWKAWRIRRLLEILENKSQGLTDKQVAERMPISKATVSRELNSPQAAEIGRGLRKRAEGMIWPLIERQLSQIEGDVTIKPAQKLFYRGLLIGMLTRLVPKQIEQKIEGEIITYNVESLLDRMLESDVGKTGEEEKEAAVLEENR